MKNSVKILAILLFSVLKFTPSASAQNNVGPWIGDYDANGLPYVWTSVYDEERFWSLQIAFSYHWGMSFAAHIEGELIQVWQPSFVFNGNYKVKPDQLDGKRMNLFTAGQINKIIGMLDSGDCNITLNFYINGEPKTKSFHYCFYPGTLGTAMDLLLDNEE